MTEALVLPREIQESLVREAARAPSVHNVQPARWRFPADGDVVLLREVGRELPVGDPTGHDLHASLGAALEGMSIALSRIGYGLAEVHPDHDSRADGCEPVLRARLVRGAALDPLAAFVDVRRSYRGKFVALTEESRSAVEALAGDDARVVTSPSAVAEIAALHDRATWHFESRREYHAELWSWLRLDRHDPRYDRDGLNADCLALSNAERFGARIALRPGVFGVLSSLGVARHLVSERGQVESASGVVLFTPPTTLDPLDVGRRFYRLWLEIARAGLHAAPMSASADHVATRDALARSHRVPADRRVANVLRVGRAPEDGVAKSPRLPVTEWLV